MSKVLPREFYLNEDVVGISKALLGKCLVTNFEGIMSSGMIVETEAYRAPDDKACHAYANKLTDRTRTMFAQGGQSYVYICYGIHHLFNVVTAPKGMAHAVLIRAVEPIDGKEVILQRRGLNKWSTQLSSGPGKVGKALGIYKHHDNLDLTTKEEIWIEDRGVQLSPDQIISGPRVGMSTAEECSHWPWRFRIKGNPWSSKPDVVSYPHISRG